MPRDVVVVKLKSGQMTKIPVDCRDGLTPQHFVIHCVLQWMWAPIEILRIDVFKGGVLDESYEPVAGWFKK